MHTSMLPRLRAGFDPRNIEGRRAGVLVAMAMSFCILQHGEWLHLLKRAARK